MLFLTSHAEIKKTLSECQVTKLKKKHTLWTMILKTSREPEWLVDVAQRHESSLRVYTPLPLLETTPLLMEVSIDVDNKAKSYWAGKQPTGISEYWVFSSSKKNHSSCCFIISYYVFTVTNKELKKWEKFCPLTVFGYFWFFSICWCFHWVA